jgi:hypothetical protein
MCAYSRKMKKIVGKLNCWFYIFYATWNGHCIIDLLAVLEMSVSFSLHNNADIGGKTRKKAKNSWCWWTCMDFANSVIHTKNQNDLICFTPHLYRSIVILVIWIEKSDIGFSECITTVQGFTLMKNCQLHLLDDWEVKLSAISFRFWTTTQCLLSSYNIVYLS